MRPLLPVTWGTVGLMFALFANGLFLLGVDAEPATADGPRPLKAVAVTGSLMGGVTLTVMSLWFVVAGPLGSDTTTVVQLQLLYSAIGLTYGMHLLGTAVVQVKDWDLRIVGNLGLLAAGLTLLWCALLVGYARAAGMSTLHVVLQELALAAFGATGVALWAATHGRISPRAAGTVLLTAIAAALYFHLFGGGLLTPPGM